MKAHLYVLIALVFALLIILLLLQSLRKQSDTPPPPPLVIQSSPPPPPPPRHIPMYDTNYKQIGLLTSNETDKDPVVLPLFGRKIRSDRWQYYTATDKTNMLRVPLRVNNRDCEDIVGCNEIYNGDKLLVEIYQGREFTATIYKLEAPQYFA